MKYSIDPLWVTLYDSAMQISGSALKNCMWDCLSIFYQLIIEFLGNIVYQVKVVPVNDLGNNLSLKWWKFS